jgi:hypothetical protein
MADETFSDFVSRERNRLNADREAIRNQQRELETKLRDIDREAEAINAYEAAKSGKGALSGRSAGSRRGGGGRRGSKREALMQVIQQGNGLTRGEILERMGLKGDKSGEMSVSNALTALTKANQVNRRDGKYIAA